MVLTRIGSAKGDFASSLNGIRHRSKSPSRHSIARSFDGSCFEPTISTHDSYASHDFSSTLGGHLKSLKLFKTLRNVALKGCALPLFQESETGREVQNQRGVIRAQQTFWVVLLSRSAFRRTRSGPGRSTNRGGRAPGFQPDDQPDGRFCYHNLAKLSSPCEPTHN